jgi:hypothetical protein
MYPSSAVADQQQDLGTHFKRRDISFPHLSRKAQSEMKDQKLSLSPRVKDVCTMYRSVKIKNTLKYVSLPFPWAQKERGAKRAIEKDDG